MTLLLAMLALTAPIQQSFTPPPLASKPRPLTKPETWISADDYPAAANGAVGTVTYRLSADATGKVFACTIVASSGSAVLDDRTCTLLMGRARFDPARDGKGAPIPFSWSSRYAWVRPH